jgi:hypothetical protein
VLFLLAKRPPPRPASTSSQCENGQATTPHFQSPPFLWKKEEKKRDGRVFLYPSALAHGAESDTERAEPSCGIASLIVPSSSKPRLSELIPPSTHTLSLRKLYWGSSASPFPSSLSLGPCALPEPSATPIPPFPSYFIQCPFPKSCRLYANP